MSVVSLSGWRRIIHVVTQWGNEQGRSQEKETNEMDYFTVLVLVLIAFGGGYFSGRLVMLRKYGSRLDIISQRLRDQLE